jgi:hypothetical protein
MCRAGTQVNIVSTKPPHALWSENRSAVSRVELYVARAGITGSGTGAIGTSMTFLLAAPADGGAFYQAASSFGNGPLWIGSRMMGLTPDNLFFLSALNVAPGLFIQYAGTLGSTGAGKAALAIPKITAIRGLPIHTAYLTLSTGSPPGISSISNTFSFTIP